MQKKLYFLNEEEKNRILNLHESRTKKQYLISEQEISGVSQEAINKILSLSKKNKSALRGSYLFPTQQKEIDVEFGSGTYQKFLDNGGEKLLQGQGSTSSQAILSDLETKLWNDRKNRAETLESKCLTLNMPYKWDNVSAEFLDMFTSGPKWSELPNILSKLKTVNDFCQLNSNIKNQKEYTDVADNFKYEKGISNWIYKNVFYPSSWKKYFEEPLKNVLKSAGFKTIDSGSNIEMADKKQEDKKIVEKPKSGKVVVLRKTYSDQIKNTLSLDPTTTLSDSDIKMIYDKLVQKGMIK